TFAKCLGPGISLQHFRRSKSLDRHEGGAESDAQFDLDSRALNLVPNVLKGVERPPQMADCLLVSATTQGLGGCALVVWDGPRNFVATLKMLRHPRRDHAEPAGPGRFQPTADASMAQGPPRRRQAVVQQLTVEIMPEGVELCELTIWPSGRSGPNDEHALQLQGRAAGLNLLDVNLQCSRSGGGRELATDDARRSQQVAVALAKIVDLSIDEAPDVVRDRDDRTRRHETLLGQLVDEAGHEQRVAAR